MERPSRNQWIHFVGIGGIGVSALAQLAQARGYKVSGSDMNIDLVGNPALARLEENGATLFSTHSAENVDSKVDLLVISAAISTANSEVTAAEAHGIRVVSRADYLGELMAAHRGPKIAVSGTHGKTTTTGMIGVMLQNAGLDPTVFVGGEIAQIGGNVRIGSDTGPFVAEACEAYDSFLSLKPDIAVITNIEADHLDHYSDFDGVLKAFEEFASAVPNTGNLVACMDDAGVRQLERNWTKSVEICKYGIEFGIESVHGVRFVERVALGLHPEYNILIQDEQYTVRLQTPGRHNVQNSLAAVLVGALLNLTGKQIADGLAEFVGVTRRQEVLANTEIAGGSVIVMDDYAHHPTEINATLSAVATAYPGRRVVAVFQPHLYSRTRDFLEEFAVSLSRADILIVTGIYAAREKPIPGVRASDIVSRASSINPETTAVFVPHREDVPRTVAALVNANDLVLFVGAGDIREQAEQFVEILAHRSDRK